jgi:hypothetical protein
MATHRKKLSRAKAAAAKDSLDTLLHDTTHDTRLSTGDRAALEHAAHICATLEHQLRTEPEHI